ncbi:ATP-dependent zinc protease family protein [Parasphingorhabdus halotolerans]|uniref:ATP-dependent zinc protease n=1 Tax=Parasphingorhabdus halotolerans TaxID=2725558 RepID=A0A6H2DMM4_9SPHN|nr:RimK/LysX family protein [Parasphingorhabdus halotolerans]QJB69205.1 ATP-dependent zinc protease [Parasphingorhabdus halotolerans]
MAKPIATAPKKLRRKLKQPCEIGWCELVDLPDFGQRKLHAKIDSGARTSSLHAVRIQPFEKNGEEWVRFTIPKSPEHAAQECESRVYDHRAIKSSNGKIEQRYVIETLITLGPLTWAGHITLANRQSMAFPMLIGRRALRRGFLVNCGKRWMLGRPDNRPLKKEKI